MKKLKTFVQIVLTSSVFLIASPALAILDYPKNVTQVGSITVLEVLENIGDWLLALSGALAVLFLIYGGIIYITGGPKGEENAKKIIMNSIIGLIVIALSAVLANLALNIAKGTLVGTF